MSQTEMLEFLFDEWSQLICGLDSLIFIWIKDKLCSLQKLDIMYFCKENIKSVVQICVLW